MESSTMKSRVRIYKNNNGLYGRFALFCILFTLLFVSPVIASTDFSAPTLNLTSGQNLTFSLSLNGVTNAAGISYSMTFNKSVISIASIEKNLSSMGSNATLTSNIDNTNGSALVFITDIDPLLSTTILTPCSEITIHSLGVNGYSDLYLDQARWTNSVNFTPIPFDTLTHGRITIQSFSPPSVINGTIINQSATIYIGEQGLNVTRALNMAQGNPDIDGVPSLTNIGWWANDSYIGFTAPTKTISLTARYKSLTVSPADFVGYAGNWHVIQNDGITVTGLAFSVSDPTLDLKVWDFDHASDVTGSSVPLGSHLGFRIDTNMYGAVVNRTPINPATDGFIDIRVKNASSVTIQALYNDSTNAGSLAGPNSLLANFVNVQPYFWGSAGTYAWETDALDNGTYIYPYGNYTVTAESTLNHMKDNYKNAGADYVGKTVSPTYTITIVPALSAPVANFSANRTSGSSPLSVSFTDSSLNLPTGWAWFFGDENYTQPWTEVNASAGWTARYAHSSVTMPDGSIILMGGYDGSNKNDVWRSNDYGITWVQITASTGWSARHGSRSVAMPDGSIVMMGGHDGSVKNDTWRSTDNGATWTLLNASSGWSARYIFPSVGMPDGTIVLMGGGIFGGPYENDTWRSTDNGITWVQQNSSAGWSKRFGPASVALPDGSIILMGGLDGAYRNDTWRSTDNGVTWTLLNASSGWSGRYQHTSTAMPDSSILLMGGEDITGRKNDMWRSTDQGVTWTQVNASSGWSERNLHTSVAMPDGSVVLMGGPEGSGRKNDVWRFQPAGSSSQNPSHSYTAEGNYTVALQAYNTGGYNRTRKTGYIKVTDGPSTGPVHNQNTGINYTTIKTAIQNATAGDIILIDSGTYFENVNITKMLTLRGNDTGTGQPVINALGNSGIVPFVSDCTIEQLQIQNATTSWAGGIAPSMIHTANLTVRNITITDSFSGIYLAEVNTPIISDVTISNSTYGLLFSSVNGTHADNITIRGTTSSMHGIVFWDSAGNVFSRIAVVGFPHYGINLDSGNKNNRFISTNVSTCSYGFYFAGSSSNTTIDQSYAIANTDRGIVFHNSNNNSVTSTIIRNNVNRGIAMNSSFYNTVANNTIISNTVGIILSNTSSNNTFYNNNFNNPENIRDPLSVNTWNLTKTPGTNINGGSCLAGNYWSDYAGVDTDGDGIGNTLVPYTAEGNITFGGDWLPLTNRTGGISPTADFVASPSYGRAPLLVHFTDRSATSPTTWNWSFGDGNTTGSTLQNPVHLYERPGIYSVSLNVTNTSGYAVLTKNNSVAVDFTGSTMFRSNKQHTGVYDDGSITPTNNKQWNYTTGDLGYSSPAVYEGVVFVGSNDRRVYALNASTGVKIWDYLTGDRIESSPAVADGIVYIGSRDHNIYALNADTGAKIWNFTTIWEVASSPVLANGIVYVGSDDTKMYALNATSGIEIWNYTTNHFVESSPAVSEGSVYVGSWDKNLYALHVGNGTLKWNFTTGDVIESSPAVSGGTVFFGSKDKNVYALNTSTGTKLWNYTTGNGVHSCPAVSGGVVYVGGEDFRVYALNAASGAEIWNYTTGSWVKSSPAIANGIVYIGSNDGNVYALNASSGTKLWDYPTGGGIESSPAIVGGRVYIGSGDGNLYALGGIGPAPIASFTANITYGTVPLAVQFYDNSTGSPTNWNWSFGDGNFSAIQNPLQTYSVPGTFTVSLNATNTGGSNFSIRTNYIVVTPPKPVPAFSGTPTSGTLPLTVSFTDESLNTNGWAWFFGDDNFTASWTEMNASAGWTARNNFNSVVMPDGSIVLTGGADSGGYKNDTWRSTDNGTTWTRMTLHAGWSERYGHSGVVMPDGSIVLMGGYSVGADLNDVWRSIDDGTTWTLVNASAGWTPRESHSSVVMPDGSIVLMGGVMNGGTPCYNDVWRSTDYGATWTQVNAGALWPARWCHTSVAMSDGSIVLTGGLSTGWVAWNDVWRSTDNGVSWTLVNASALWPVRWGHSSVTLPDKSIMLMGGGRSNVGTYYQDVWRSTDNGAIWEEINASAGWSPRMTQSSVVLPDSSIVIMGGYNGGVYYNDAWRFVPTGSSLQNPSHTYTSAGNYNVSLQAFYTGGYNSTRKTGYITVTGTAPVSSFFANVTSGTVPLTVQFNETSTNTPATWNWSFGDTTWFNTTSSALANTTHTFSSAGTYTVNLTAGNRAGSNTSSRSNYIVVTPPKPIPAFSGTPTSGALPLTVSFTDGSLNTTGWAWFFGDENYTAPWTQVNASAGWGIRDSHTSVVMPDGSIILMAGYNGASNLRDIWKSTDSGVTWTLVNATAGWSARHGPTSVRMPDNSIVLMAGWDGSYLNDVWRSTDRGVTWIRQTASAGWSGRYIFSSVVLPDGSIVIMGGGPYLGPYTNDTWRSTDYGVSWTQQNASSGWTKRWGHTSVVMPDGSIVLMGGLSDTGWKNDTWRSADKGVTWTLMNASSGWEKRDEHNSVAMPDGSIIALGGKDDNLGIRFNDIWRSTDMGVTWTGVNASAGWSKRFGTNSNVLPDGSIVLTGGNIGTGRLNDVWRFQPTGSSLQSPSHTYTTAGNYSVALQAYNTGGYNSTRKMGYINVTGGTTAPVANFTANVTSGTVPLAVQFYDNSTGSPTGWNWSFGDGTYSVSQNSSHIYTPPGYYTVSLNVTNAGGYNVSTQTNLIAVDFAKATMFRNTRNHSGIFSTGGIQPTANLNWSYSTGGIITSSPAVADGTLFVSSYDHDIYAFNTTTGKKIWNFSTGHLVGSSPALADGVVYVGSQDTWLYALNAQTGVTIWKSSTGSGIGSSPVVQNGIVYVGSDDQNVYAFNAGDGTTIWTSPTGGSISSSPAIANGTVYVGSDDHNVYALNAITGTKIWNVTTGGNVGSSPAVVNGTVYVGSEDNNLYALDALTGSEIWRYTAGNSIYSSPAVADGIVYVGSGDYKVYALNALTGAFLWEFTTGEWGVGSSPAVADGRVYIGYYKSIYALNATTGAIVWNYVTGDIVRSSPVVAQGRVFAGSDDFTIYALGGPALPSSGPVQNMNTTLRYPTIMTGIGNATAGDTLRVDSGVYTERVNVTKQLTLIGNNTGSGFPVVDVGSPGVNTAITLSADNCTIDGFTVRNALEGARATGSDATIQNIIATSNHIGISLDGTSRTVIQSALVYNNSLEGVKISGSMNTTIRNSRILNNTGIGLKAENSSTNTTISDNIVQLNNDWGIHIIESSGTAILNNDLTSNNFGIVLELSHDTRVIRNNASNSTWSGIHLDSAMETQIEDNDVHGNGGSGIVLINGSRVNTFSGNRVLRNAGEAIMLKENSSWNTFSSNNASWNLGGAGGIYLEQSESNTFRDTTVDSNNNGFMLTQSSNNNTLIDNRVTNNRYDGLSLERSSNTTIRANRFTKNLRGIHLSESHNTTVIGNTMLSETQTGVGITENSSWNTITDTFVDGPGQFGLYIVSNARNNRVLNLTAMDRDHGLYLDSANNNRIENSHITNSSTSGITLISSTGNLIANNVFNNSFNVQDNGNNTWNTTKYAGTNIIGRSYRGGNFWSDYSGVDTNGDGIGTTHVPYTNDGSITFGGDWLPLTNNTSSIPEANFTANTTSGVVPLTVQFDDTSTGSPVTWNWSFGDGGISSIQNPSHTYSTTGTYSVSLSASNAGGTNTTTRTNFITVRNPGPVANFTTNTTSGIAPLTVQFNDTSTGSPTFWNWSFGDGGISSIQNPSHTYSTIGTYSVSLNILNAWGNNTTTRTNYITVINSAPVTNFTANVTSGIAPLTVQFYDTSTNVPTSWNWSFGDGSTSSEKNPVHTYGSGIYPVSLTATNAGGSAQKTTPDYVTVYAANYVQSFAIPGLTASGNPQQITLNTSTFIGTINITGNVVTGIFPPGSDFQRMKLYLNPVNISGSEITGNLSWAEFHSTTFPVTLPCMGTQAPCYVMNLSKMPQPSDNVSVRIIGNTSTSERIMFQAKAAEGGMTVGDIGYTLHIQTTVSPTTINGAGISQCVPTSWANGFGNYSIKVMRISSSGTTSILDTILTSCDGTNSTFYGWSPGGFSTFAIAGLQNVPPPPPPNPDGGSDGPNPAPAPGPKQEEKQQPPVIVPNIPAAVAVIQQQGVTPVEVGESFHMGFEGMNYNADGSDTLYIDLSAAQDAGATITAFPDRLELYQHNSPGVRITFWGNQFNYTSTRVSGKVSRAEFVTDPIIAELDLGNVSGSIRAVLPALSKRVTINNTINSIANPVQTRQFQEILAKNNLTLTSVAYTMEVQKVNLTTGSANVTLTIPSSWVDHHGGIDAVRITRISEITGTTELISTVYTGTDPAGNRIFRGDSPRGTSLFGLVTAQATAIEKETHPNETYIPVSKPAMGTNVGMFGWLFGIVTDNPVVLVLVVAVLAAVIYFAWWKRRL